MGSDIMGGLEGPHRESTVELLRTADLVTSKSRFMDKTLEALGVRPENIRRLTWGIDLERFRSGIETVRLRAALGIPADSTVVFCPRICVPRTNKKVVLTAFAGLETVMKGDAVLVVSLFSGERTHVDELLRLGEELGLGDRVRFVPAIDAADMPAYLNMSDVVVSVPAADGVPQTVYQALACGCRVIISDIPHTQDFIDQGFQVAVARVGDPVSLTRLLDEQVDLARAGDASHVDRNRQLSVQRLDKRHEDAQLVGMYAELLGLETLPPTDSA